MTDWPPSAVFLDRDGVLIEDVSSYVRSWDEVEVFPRSVEACRQLTLAGIPLIVVTNQACVGKGILSFECALELNHKILGELEKGGGKVLDAYICPHRPDEGCHCRKPLPGMIVSAAEKHNIDLERAILVGDAITDLKAAAAAHVKGFLVRTGRGKVQEELLSTHGLDVGVYDDLLSLTTSLAEKVSS